MNFHTLILTCDKLRQKRFNSKFINNYEFINGFTQNTLQDKYNIGSNNYFNEGYNDTNWDPVTLARCYGHLKCWQRCIELKKPCLILEDDVRLCSTYKKY